MAMLYGKAQIKQVVEVLDQDHESVEAAALACLEIPERFWTKVSVSPTGCWLWNAAIRANGYGAFWFDNQMVPAHRFIFTRLNGDIADDIQVDHICRTRHCVRPSHLQAVTRKENNENHGGARRDSHSGIRGAHWDARRGKWAVQVRHFGVRHWGGYHDSLDDADQAAIALRNRLFTNNLRDRGAVA